MKLGVVVLYYVTEENGDLLDIHLRQISANTAVPYTIYGADNNLEPAHRKILELDPHVRLMDLPKTELTFVQEHSFYLEALTRAAIEDGCTHVATLHVDSFPVKKGWAEELAAQLTEERPLAAILERENGDTARPNPAGMIFTREFYLKYNPTYLLPHEIHKSDDFAEFMERTRQAQYHSGIGYGYLMEAAGLDWVKLPRSNARNDHHTMGGLYGDMFFHLGAATRGKWFYIDNRTLPYEWFSRKYHRIMRALNIRLSPKTMKNIRRMMPTWMLWYCDRPAAGTRVFDRIRKQLFKDPDGYINYLRGMQPPQGKLGPRAVNADTADAGNNSSKTRSQTA